MARKRKIPARKHHGIRDPLKQKEDKEKILRKVTNHPPVRGDEEKLSNKFARFKKLIDNVKAGKKIKRPHAGREDKPKKLETKSKIAASTTKFKKIKQFLDETDEDYLRRVNRVTSESLRDAEYEAKYNVEIVRDSKTGAIQVKKRPLNEVDELLKQKKKQRNNKNGKGKIEKLIKPMDPKLKKELIKQAIKEDNEERQQEKLSVKPEYQHDVIKFGEIVHAPPTLSTLPRKAQKSETVPRPGKKNNLLLKSMLTSNEPEAKKVISTNTKKSKVITKSISKAQLKGKRKDLPAATRSMLENEQIKMIELYRNLKKSKEKPLV